MSNTTSTSTSTSRQRQRQRQQLVVDRRTSNSSSNNSNLFLFLFHLAIATICSILKTTDAFRMPSGKRMGVSSISSSISSSSSLFRQQRRRQSSSAGEQEGEEFNFYPTPSSITATATKSKRQLLSGLRSRISPKRTTTTTTTKRVEVTTIEELDRYWPRCLDGEECPLEDYDDYNPYTIPLKEKPVDYNALLKGISIKGDTQIIGSKDHPDFVHPVIQLMHERRRKQLQQQRKQQQQQEDNEAAVADDGDGDAASTQTIADDSSSKKEDDEKIALVIEGGGMRGCVSAGMVCAIHCLGLSDTIDVVYGASAGAVIAAYFVSNQLPYFGPEVYYDALTTPSSSSNPAKAKSKSNSERHNVVDHYENDYFIDLKRLTRSMGLGLCDPRLLKDVWTRRIHGKPLMNLHYMFQNIMLKTKRLDYETFLERQKVQPLRVVATGLSSEQPVIMSHEDGHFNTIEDVCHSLHASCLLPGIAGPVMNVLKNVPKEARSSSNGDAATTTTTTTTTKNNEKPTFVLRNSNSSNNDGDDDDDYEPLADAMLSAPIPYDIAHEEGATHVLVIRSSPDGTNLLAAPSVMTWIGSMIYKRYFLKKNNLPSMYKRSQIEQRHQRVYAQNILELNERANVKNNSKQQNQYQQHQTMTIALEPGSDEVSHLETSREGIFKGVRQGFARAYDALVEDPAMRGKGMEMALRYFPDEILEYDPNDNSNDSLSSSSDSDSAFKSAFEKYLDSTGVVPKIWTNQQEPSL